MKQAENEIDWEEIYLRIAEEWEARDERVREVAEQVREIHRKLVKWDVPPADMDELDWATMRFSDVVVSYECCQWLPFRLVPNWEDDLFCLVLGDEDIWREWRNEGKDIAKLAAELRKEITK